MKFELDNIEVKTFEKWKKKLKESLGVINSSDFTFTFTPTGIGTKIVVVHTGSGEEKDITNYGNW